MSVIQSSIFFHTILTSAPVACTLARLIRVRHQLGRELARYYRGGAAPGGSLLQGRVLRTGILPQRLACFLASFLAFSLCSNQGGINRFSQRWDESCNFLLPILNFSLGSTELQYCVHISILYASCCCYHCLLKLADSSIIILTTVRQSNLLSEDCSCPHPFPPLVLLQCFWRWSTWTSPSQAAWAHTSYTWWVNMYKP